MEHNLDQLLNNFTVVSGSETEETPETPETLDSSRLEQEIREVFQNRRFLTQTLSALLGIATIRGSVHLMARLGLPAIATGTMGFIVVALAFGHALTKIGIQDGRPSLDSDFLIELLKASGIAGAVWLATDEHREISHQSSTGTKAFIEEVKQFEINPNSHPVWLMPLSVFGLGLLAIALLATVFRRHRREFF
ncbi:hypothetical protein [Coleofasciculus sp.]|uniref:hypothetical protein n=1 Tax=Coleofasciculus sp. TaxID=3100458 RepID=UPI0039FAA7DB